MTQGGFDFCFWQLVEPLESEIDSRQIIHEEVGAARLVQAAAYAKLNQRNVSPTLYEKLRDRLGHRYGIEVSEVEEIIEDQFLVKKEELQSLEANYQASDE